MELQRVWTVQGILFTLVFIGFLLKRVNLIKSENKSFLTDLVLHVFLPSSIVNSFQISFEAEMVKTFGVLIGLSISVLIISYFLGVFFFSKYSNEQKKVLRFGVLISNAAFIGMPVAESFYGLTGLMYASVYIIPIRLFVWTIGLSMFTSDQGIRDGLKKGITHPCMIAVYIGMALMISGIRIMEPVNTTVLMLSRCTTPIILILIGSIIGEVEDLKTMFVWDAMRFSIFRVIIIPAIVYLITLILQIDTIAGSIAVLLAAMPAGSMTTVLAEKFNSDYVLGTKIVVLSALMSLVTIPVWGMVLSGVF